ncbi:MAG TPA: response regulator, partial [Dongiaceae bacterium]|nr:response regulator [Dongiaceae bacterium]
MKRILLVDDDPLVLRVYGEGLRLRGFEVETAEDGLAAAKVLQKVKPDAIVLDLMMPKLSGADVLKYIRGQANLANVPVVVLSNDYITDLTRQAAAARVDRRLMKSECTPAMIAETLASLFNAQDAKGEGTQRTGAGAAAPIESRTDPEAPLAPTRSPESPSTPPQAGAFLRQMLPLEDQTETRDTTKLRQDFLDRGPATLWTLRKLFRAFRQASDDAQRSLRLQSLYTKVHFLTVAARLSECHRLAQVASVLEALLLELTSYPARISTSVLSTVGTAVDFLRDVFEHDRKAVSGFAPAAQTLALVVEDDAVCRHVLVSALHHANFKVEEAGDPLAALPLVSEKKYGLITLDLEMPGMDGFEFCRRVRQLPGYEHTPVIYVTSHSEVENRIKGAFSGGQ